MHTLILSDHIKGKFISQKRNDGFIEIITETKSIPIKTKYLFIMIPFHLISIIKDQFLSDFITELEIQYHENH